MDRTQVPFALHIVQQGRTDLEWVFRDTIRGLEEADNILVGELGSVVRGDSWSSFAGGYVEIPGAREDMANGWAKAQEEHSIQDIALVVVRILLEVAHTLLEVHILH